jgi:hypothetical protein
LDPACQPTTIRRNYCPIKKKEKGLNYKVEETDKDLKKE